MENTQQNNNQALEPGQAAAKAALLAECERLTAAGVTFVAVHFDGYGDDGTTEEVKCYDGEWYASGEHEPVKHDASHLQEHFEALVPFGYENDCGGLGDVVLDVAARELTVERNDRFEDYTTTTYEVYLYGPPTQARREQRKEVRRQSGRLSPDSQLVLMNRKRSSRTSGTL